MSDKNKKHKKSFYDYAEDIESFDFDDIPFAEIGVKIKNSVNGAIKAFSSSSKKNLPATRNPKVCEQKPPQAGLSILAKIASVILAPIFLAMTIGSYSEIHYGGGFTMLFATLISGALTISVPYALWKLGNRYKRLSDNYVRFLRELGDNTVISIRDLASGVAQSEEETTKDLLYMMRKSYFKQARIVEDGKIFILDIPTFKLYKEKLDQIPSYRKNLTDDVEIDGENLSVEDLNKERSQEIIAESITSLDKLSEKRDEIESPSFKEHLGKLIENSTDILKIIEKYPDKATGLGKFSTYYLPTSLKLATSYKEFEMVNSMDSRIVKSMGEIEESIKTIAEAFDKMKIDLLDDRAMDIKTEIDTINLLLKQEGLAEDDWGN
ncbi:5-bromo-4-chloroindolyl phosphate hydrolysis family protein [uncultured Anaerococcus sp.]|uniref:5-bromo-4-chloroindolyl phosphate hydrolysis family protein n=1 Tax=uncultured Anaerococcus sp. TaxID=293428 RepID=UPI002804E9E2|nr:5-bromo-4-chloroindolyl phosphate hydrolysis family protein [uncultured Anaerococcus sp.]MDU3137517.1 5-bromo-4-chloroindolyl phosphate hydrolysis family protein [Anaerococcus prevotii]